MPPKAERDSLLSYQKEDESKNLAILDREASFSDESSPSLPSIAKPCIYGAAAVLSVVTLGLAYHQHASRQPIGPYKLVECQEGKNFFEYYDFLDGPDSIGSAGYNTYVSRKRATEIGIMNVTNEQGQDYVYMSSAPSGTSKGGPRESIRLEGKRRMDRGLFLLDLAHMPAGCGAWPAFWLTDEAAWPDHGEIDVVEGINHQAVAKTALHTSESCSMYAHVSPFDKTGVWDTATGIPNTWTGKPDTATRVEADNCWVMAPHQWENQGCVAVHTDNETLGEPLNQQGGGVFVLDWDPANKYIKSYVFRAGVEGIPENLQQAMDTADATHEDHRVEPDPASWNALPYAYFAIGEDTGCSSDHFKNMRVVINLAFCGNVAGNRFQRDCPALAKQFQPIKSSSSSSSSSQLESPIDACNAFIGSNPESLKEAYWKIRGLYVYEREMR